MNADTVYAKIVEGIIKEQENIIGPIALEQAKRVKGLMVDLPHHVITFKGNASTIIEDLIEQYRDFFGQVSVEVCRNATKKLISQIPPEQRPALLK